MAEHRRADRSREKRERERRERLQRRRGGIAGREEQLRKHEHGGRAVDVEIEELDRRTDQAREKHAPRRHCGRIISARSSPRRLFPLDSRFHLNLRRSRKWKGYCRSTVCWRSGTP